MNSPTRPRMSRVLAALAVPFLLALGAACASTSSPGGATQTTSSSTDACNAHVDAARGKLQAVLDANMACTTDADCVVVAFGASCFDSCSRVMAASGKAAYDAEGQAVNAGACKAYTDDGCPPMIAPPCAPPADPTCKQGRCE